jgi:hypothetical protein
MLQLDTLSQFHPAFVGFAIITLLLAALHETHIILDILTVVVRHFRRAFRRCRKALLRFWRALIGRDDDDDSADDE